MKYLKRKVAHLSRSRDGTTDAVRIRSPVMSLFNLLLISKASVAMETAILHCYLHYLK